MLDTKRILFSRTLSSQRKSQNSILSKYKEQPNPESSSKELVSGSFKLKSSSNQHSKESPLPLSMTSFQGSNLQRKKMMLDNLLQQYEEDV